MTLALRRANEGRTAAILRLRAAAGRLQGVQHHPLRVTAAKDHRAIGVAGREDRQHRHLPGPEDVQKGMASAKGFIKKELGRRLSLRYIPEIVFSHDRSLESASHMEKLLDQLNRDDA